MKLITTVRSPQGMLRKYLRIMKLSFFFLLIVVYCWAIPDSHAQNSEINLSTGSRTLRELFTEIETKSDFIFFYNDNAVDLSAEITVDKEDVFIEDLLSMTLKGSNTAYKIVDRQIILYRDDTLNNSPQQSRIAIQGRVVDEQKEPLIGVSVVLKGTNRGVTTDIDGKFNIMAEPGQRLIFSYVGYVTQEIPINNSTTINVQLREDSHTIEEVVIVGYGTIAKSDLTGSVSTINTESINERAVTSIEQMLQGQVSGVQITQNTGGTGSGISFNIRGATSITGSNQPLIVIDGYPMDSDNSNTKMADGSQSGYLGNLSEDNALANLNPNDIASIEILKDASSTAIYGSRGANGVVLISTKRGQSGKDRIDYSVRFDVSQVPKKLKVLSTADFISYSNEGYINSTGEPHSNYNTEEKIQAAMATNTNWQDLVFRTSLTQNHQLNMSGGTDKLKYAMAFGYYGQEGIIKNSRFDRGSLRINLDREFNSRFKVGLSMSGVMSKNLAAMQSSNTDEASMSVILASIRTRPVASAITDDDEIDTNLVGNPLTLVNLCEDQNKTTRVMANVFAEYTILPGLSVKARGGVDNSNAHRDFYHPRGTSLGNLEGGYAYSGDVYAFNYVTEFTLNLNKTFRKKHRVNAVAGYTWQKWNRRTQGLNAMNFPNDNMLYYDFGSASSFSAPTTRRSESALASWLGRANYSFDNRYLFTLTGRADGSTRLAPGNQWRFFPSAALGWNVHNEAFMKQFEFLSELKLRGSYGLSGNQSIAIGATKASLGSGTAVINQTLVTSYAPGNMPNDQLHWETTKQLNLGMDISLYNNRIKVGFNYYRKVTDDLLIALTIPPSNGYTRYNTNQGSIENKGYEFDLGFQVLKKEFTWDISGNISINRNKVLNLGELESLMGGVFQAIGGQNLHIAIPGKPLGSFYGYRIEGIYQTEEEVANGPKDSASPVPGSFKYKDLNKDGQITSDDREIIGDPYPDFIFGLSNNFSWKGISLSVLLQGSIGQELINGSRHYLDALTVGYQSANVSQEAYNNRWTGPGTSDKYPRPTSSTTPFDSRFTDFIVEDASYVRIKNITLSYNIPTHKISFINSLRIFASGENLVTFTNYKGYDPEINSRAGKGMMPGIDYGSIPQYQTVSLGLNIGF